MKRLKFEVLVVAAAIICTFSAVSVALPNAKTVPSSGSPGSTKVEKSTWAVSNDLSNIKMDRKNISVLSEKIKADRKAGNETAGINDRKELSKSQADLVKDKSFLVADRKELVRTHKLAINSSKDVVKGDNDRLALSEKMLKKDIATQKSTDIQTDALLVSDNQQALKKDEAKLDSEQKSLDNDLAFVNKATRDVNPGLMAFLEKKKPERSGSNYASR